MKINRESIEKTLEDIVVKFLNENKEFSTCTEIIINTIDEEGYLEITIQKH